MEALDKALGVGPKMVKDSAELNQVCDHILQLLRAATSLFHNGFYSTAVFIAITALEETAKAHVGTFRKPPSTQTKTRNDPLYRHTDKHLLAASPTICMGSRISEAIGKARVAEIMEMASSGQLKALRESSLYFERTGETLVVPTDVLSMDLARELLLFSLEAFDDALVGYTDHSVTVGESASELFTTIAEI